MRLTSVQSNPNSFSLIRYSQCKPGALTVTKAQDRFCGTAPKANVKNGAKSEKIRFALSEAFDAGMKPILLIRDLGIGLGFTLIATAIPPHIHGLLLMPACLLGGFSWRAIPAFKMAYTNPNPEALKRHRAIAKNTGNDPVYTC